MRVNIAVGDCIIFMVQLCVVFTELGELFFKWFILLQSASTELVNDVLSADIRSSRVQAGCCCVPHPVRVSHSIDHTLYFGRTGKSDQRPSFCSLSFPIIIVFKVVEMKGQWFRIIPSDDCICSDG